MEKKFKLSSFGYEAVVGKFAKQADCAIWLQQGGTVVLSTVVSDASPEFPGFLPLTIEYREQLAAVGKIPGGYLKREGRPTDKEILTGRLIDRALRPLFPLDYFNKVQIVTTVYSFDGENLPHTLSLLASSLALMLSKVPFMGPVGVCEVVRIKGQWLYNPTHAQAREADAKIIVAGNAEGVNMVEGSAQEVGEEELVEVIFKAHEYIKEQVEWQRHIAGSCLVEKEKYEINLDWQGWAENARTVLTDQAVKAMFTFDKIERSDARRSLESAFQEKYHQAIEESKLPSAFISYVFEKTLNEVINELIYTLGHRIDNRDFSSVRAISTEVGLLPFNHGSALFTRGRTQVLSSVTLGGGQDEMRVESLTGEKEKTFMLHYNFPPFSVGEVRPMRGPGRREIGHGNLAANAIEAVLPKNDHFPYTIRVVADVLESDGSSSMATVCASTMALMQAGVPIAKMVSGVAMGLLMNHQGEFKVLTDIAGIEDAFGLMDFKVAGTEDGVTAIQMDIKYKSGLPRPVFEDALMQARVGRLHILGEMRKVMSAPNTTLSALVPQLVSFKVPKDKIGAIIGTGGKVIREIIEATTTTIEIEDDGLVKIFGHPGELLDKAVSWVKTLAGLIEVGSVREGKIKRAADFGYFVELVPGQDGLVHISTVPRNEQQAFMKKYQESDKVMVEVIDYDASANRIRLKIVE